MSLIEKHIQGMADDAQEKLTGDMLKYFTWMKRTGRYIDPWNYNPETDSEHTVSYGERAKTALTQEFTKEYWEKRVNDAKPIADQFGSDLKEMFTSPSTYWARSWENLKYGFRNGFRRG
jgi:hypothetical protein